MVTVNRAQSQQQFSTSNAHKRGGSNSAPCKLDRTHSLPNSGTIIQYLRTDRSSSPLFSSAVSSKVFENRVLRVFGPKRAEVTGEWRKLHNDELNNLYSLPNIVRVVKSRRLKWAGHVVLMGEDRGVHSVLVGKPEGKRPLGRPRRRWEDNY